MKNKKIESTNDKINYFIVKNPHIPISLQKINPFIKFIRGKDLNYSINSLRFSSNKAGRIVYKILSGASKSFLKEKKLEEIFIAKAFLGKSLTRKKVIYRAKGRTDLSKKRSSNLTLFLSYNN